MCRHCPPWTLDCLDLICGPPPNRFPVAPVPTQEYLQYMYGRPGTNMADQSHSGVPVCHYCQEVPGPHIAHLLPPDHPARGDSIPNPDTGYLRRDQCYCHEFPEPHSINLHLANYPAPALRRPTQSEFQYGPNEAAHVQQIAEAQYHFAADIDAQQASARAHISLFVAELDAERELLKVQQEAAILDTMKKMEEDERNFRRDWGSQQKRAGEDRRAKRPAKRPSQSEFQHGVEDDISRFQGVRSQNIAEIIALQATARDSIEKESHESERKVEELRKELDRSRKEYEAWQLAQDAEKQWAKEHRVILPLDVILDLQGDLKEVREQQDEEYSQKRYQARGAIMDQLEAMTEEVTSAIESEVKDGKVLSNREIASKYDKANTAYAKLSKEFEARFPPSGGLAMAKSNDANISFKGQEELLDVMKRRQWNLFREQVLGRKKKEREEMDQAEQLAQELETQMHISDSEKHLGDAGKESKRIQGEAKRDTAVPKAGASSKGKMAMAQDTKSDSWDVLLRQVLLTEGMTSKEIDAVFEEAEESRDPESDLKQLEEMVQEMRREGLSQKEIDESLNGDDNTGTVSLEDLERELLEYGCTRAEIEKLEDEAY